MKKKIVLTIAIIAALIFLIPISHRLKDDADVVLVALGSDNRRVMSERTFSFHPTVFARHCPFWMWVPVQRPKQNWKKC